MKAHDILEMLFRRKLLMLFAFLLALAGGYVGLRAVSPVYTATAEVLIRLGQENLFMPLLPSSSSEVRMPLAVANLEQQVNSEIQVIKSEPVAAELLKLFGASALFPGIDVRHPWYTPRGVMQQAAELYRGIGEYFYPQSADQSMDERALRRLRESIAAVPAKDSTVIDITVRSAVPQVAADAVNKLVQIYLVERTRLYQRETNAFFDAQLTALDGQLDEAERQLGAFRAEIKVLDVEQQRSALLLRLSEMRANLQNAEVATEQAARRVSVLQGQLDAYPQSLQVTASTVYQRLRDDLLRAQAELAPNRVAVARWTRLVAETSEQVETLTQAQNRSALLQQRLKVLQDSRKLYLQKIEEARVQQAQVAAQLGNVTVVSWATPSRALVSPRLGLVLGAVAAIAVFGSLGMAIGLGLLDTTLTSEDDVVRATGLPVIARLDDLGLVRE